MDIQRVVLFYLYGVLVIVAAVFANVLAKHFGIVTWHEFLPMAKEKGLIEAMSALDVLSIVFLFFLYPAIFGYIIYLVTK